MSQIPIVITGATGFLGIQIARELHQSGFNVHCLVRSQPPSDELGFAAGVHVIGEDFRYLREALLRVRPRACVHLASLFLVSHLPDQIQDLITANVTLGTLLAEASRDAGCRLFLNTGTAWEHFGETDAEPVNLYAATKTAFRDILRYYYSAHEFRVLTLKLFDTFGEGDARKKLVPLLLRAAAGEQALRMSPGEQALDLCHATDIARGFRLALERLLSGAEPRWEEFVLASGRPVKLSEMVTVLRQVVPRAVVELGGLPYRDREVMVPWGGGTVLPGWEPKIEFLQWFRTTLENDAR